MKTITLNSGVILDGWTNDGKMIYHYDGKKRRYTQGLYSSPFGRYGTFKGKRLYLNEFETFIIPDGVEE